MDCVRVVCEYLKTQWFAGGGDGQANGIWNWVGLP